MGIICPLDGIGLTDLTKTREGAAALQLITLEPTPLNIDSCRYQKKSKVGHCTNSLSWLELVKILSYSGKTVCT